MRLFTGSLLSLQGLLEGCREEPCSDPFPTTACSYLPSHLDGTHTLIGKRLAGNVNRLVETDKFLNQGGEKLNIGGSQAGLVNGLVKERW